MGEERIDRYVSSTVETDHTRTAPLAPAQRRVPQFSGAARSGILIAGSRMFGQKVDQRLALILAEQPVSLTGGIQGFGDGLHAHRYTPLGPIIKSRGRLPRHRLERNAFRTPVQMPCVCMVREQGPPTC